MVGIHIQTIKVSDFGEPAISKLNSLPGTKAGRRASQAMKNVVSKELLPALSLILRMRS